MLAKLLILGMAPCEAYFLENDGGF
eukprot:COSAG04_NODE_1705_length_5881_cov_13.667935_1_plen_24_part_10